MNLQRSLVVRPTEGDNWSVFDLCSPSSGRPHPEHDHSPGPLLPADARWESPQSAEAHRGWDQDRRGEPGAAAGDGGVSGPPEAGCTVCPGWSGTHVWYWPCSCVITLLALNQPALLRWESGKVFAFLFTVVSSLLCSEGGIVTLSTSSTRASQSTPGPSAPDSCLIKSTPSVSLTLSALYKTVLWSGTNVAWCWFITLLSPHVRRGSLLHSQWQ